MPWNFLVQFAIMVGTSVVSFALAPHPEDSTEANKLGRPTAQDGMVIPVVFGPALLRDTCVLGFGCPTTHDIIMNGGK